MQKLLHPLDTKKFTCLKRQGISTDAIVGAKFALVLSSGGKCLFSIKILEFP